MVRITDCPNITSAVYGGRKVINQTNQTNNKINHEMSLVVRKADFCICENKDADQLRGNREADQRLCFRYTDSSIPLLSKSEISSLYPSSVAVQPGLCRTWSETLKTGFLTTRLKLSDQSLVSEKDSSFLHSDSKNTVRYLSSLMAHLMCKFYINCNSLIKVLFIK